MAKTKFYAIKKGKTIGIFNDWDECKQYVLGFPGADYKGFSTKEEALNYLNEDQLSNLNTNDLISKNININDEIESKVKSDLENGYTVIFTDGSYSDELKKYSFGVYIQTIENNELKEYEFFDSYNNEKYLNTRNVAGEIFGVIKALEWAISNNKNKVKFYYDYEGIEKWAIGKWETKSDIASLYFDIFNKNKLFFDAIEFQKVKSHSNIKFNDKADRLAKLALNNTSDKRYNLGSNWCVIQDFDNCNLFLEKLQKIENIKITPSKDENKHCIIYKLNLLNQKITINYFETKSLTIQGKMSTLFIHILDILLEILEDDKFENILQNITKNSKWTNIENIDKFPSNYPKEILKLIKTGIKLTDNIPDNLDDYTWLIMEPLKALEGHLKWKLDNNKIKLSEKNAINCFDYNKENGKHELPKKIKIDEDEKNKLNNCYNFFNKYRHKNFHFKYILDYSENDNLICDKNIAKQIALECIKLIKETI